MRTLALVSAAVLAALPSAARAQRANRSISVESRASSDTALGVALTASRWLERDVHGTVAVEWEAAGEPGGRSVSGTAGVAWAPGAGRVRPRVHAEGGWRREAYPDRLEDRLVLAAGAGLEWFVRREVALTLGGAVRRSGDLALVVSMGARFGF